jgi:hypothetical protein
MNVSNCAVVGNQAVAGPGQISNGGGIDNQSATMTIPLNR